MVRGMSDSARHSALSDALSATGRWLARRSLIGIPYIWLLIFFLLPFFIVLRLSFSDPALRIPPYIPTIDYADLWNSTVTAFKAFDFENYSWITEDRIYWLSFITSLKIAAISTLGCLIIGFPTAYALAKAPRAWRPTLLMLVILPFWTSFLIRVYAWIGILKKEGLLNLALTSIGLIDEPLRIHSTQHAVYIGIIYSYLPFMILPLYATLEKMDVSLLEAAQDLGCSTLAAFWKITVPLARPGIIAGSLLVFIPAVGEFVIPDLLGGSDTLMIGKTLWTEFFSNRDWPVASAVAVLLVLMLILPIVIFQRAQENAQFRADGGGS